MLTSTFTLPLTSSTSPTFPSSSLNGPSVIITISSIERSTLCFTVSSDMIFMSASYSVGVSGTGCVPEPTNPVTRGVFRTTYHDSSFTIMSTSTYPGYIFSSSVTRFPPFTRTFFSVGTTTSKIWSCIPRESIRCLRLRATAFSYPE